MKILYFTLFSVMVNGCLVINRHGTDDGYAQTDKRHLTDSLMVSDHAFGIAETNAAQISRRIQKSEKTLLVLTATWCGHCQIEQPALIEAARSRDIVFVFVDYHLDKIAGSFKKGGYNKPVFIISSSEYGSDETRKTSVFLSQLTDGQDTVVSFPRHLVFENGEFVYSVNQRMTPLKIAEVFRKGYVNASFWRALKGSPVRQR